MAKTREELEQEASQANIKANQEFAKAQREAAEEARANAPDGAETEEEFHARIAGARATGIFGDVDTTAGAGANLTDVPSADNEAATVAVAQADAAEEGTEEANASSDEARRQVDVSAGSPSAEEVNEGAASETGSEEKAAAEEEEANAGTPSNPTEAGPASDAGAAEGGSEEAPNADAVEEGAGQV